jgi:hypothetical protein
MQSKCPKCNGTAFRILPQTANATEVECVMCGHIAPFYLTVTRSDDDNEGSTPRSIAE